MAKTRKKPRKTGRKTVRKTPPKLPRTSRHAKRKPARRATKTPPLPPLPVEVVRVEDNGTVYLHGRLIGRHDDLIGRVVQVGARPSRWLVVGPADKIKLCAYVKPKRTPGWAPKPVPPPPLAIFTARRAERPDGRRMKDADVLNAIVAWARSLDAMRIATGAR